MTQVSSVDYDAKRIHLHSDTVVNGFDIVAAYFEINALRQANTTGEQNRAHCLSAEGNISKGGGLFTPRYGLLEPGWRVVPYDGVSHSLVMLVEPVSKDGLSGRDVFDRSPPFPPSIDVDRDVGYSQFEVVTIATGSAVLDQDKTDIKNLIFNEIVENGETLTQLLRLLRSNAAGEIEVDGTTHRLKSADGLTDRIVATADATGRAINSTNPN
jgi:hypothetical protein